MGDKMEYEEVRYCEKCGKDTLHLVSSSGNKAICEKCGNSFIKNLEKLNTKISNYVKLIEKLTKISKELAEYTTEYRIEDVAIDVINTEIKNTIQDLREGIEEEEDKIRQMEVTLEKTNLIGYAK